MGRDDADHGLALLSSEPAKRGGDPVILGRPAQTAGSFAVYAAQDDRTLAYLDALPTAVAYHLGTRSSALP
jgi:hypothetical protein